MNIDPSVCARGLPRDPHGRHRLHPLVARAAEALETADVTWALLRGEYDLGDPRGDVDILVDSSRGLGAVEQALRPLGVVAVPQVEREPIASSSAITARRAGGSSSTSSGTWTSGRSCTSR